MNISKVAGGGYRVLLGVSGLFHNFEAPASPLSLFVDDGKGS